MLEVREFLDSIVVLVSRPAFNGSSSRVLISTNSSVLGGSKSNISSCVSSSVSTTTLEIYFPKFELFQPKPSILNHFLRT